MVYTVFTKPWKTEPAEELGERVSGMWFDGVELTVRDGYQAQPSDVRHTLPRVAKALAKAGVQLTHIAGAGDAEAMEDTFAAAGELGVKLIRCGGMSVAGGRWWQAYEQARRQLDTLSTLSEKYGPIAGIQNHCGQCVAPHSLGLYFLCQHYDPKHIGAVWDPAHCALDGEQPEMGLDIVWKYVCAVNFKNPMYVRTNTPESPVAEWGVRWTTGRDGIASWPRAVAALQARHWDGIACCCAEYSDPTRVDEVAAADLAFLKELMTKA